MDQQCCQESETIVLPEVSDVDLPIAMRKGVWSCTKHPIILGEIGVKEEMPMKMYCDNKATINTSHTQFIMIGLNT